MFNSASSLAIGLIVSIAVVTSSYAQPRSVYELHQEQSDYVVIAKAREQKRRLGFDNIPIEIAKLEVMSVLKGEIAENQIDVIVQAESVDLSANCCKSGKIYLMYLMKHNGEFTLIRGRDGVYLLEKLHFKGRRR
jgi:hypothetical protein